MSRKCLKKNKKFRTNGISDGRVNAADSGRDYSLPSTQKAANTEPTNNELPVRVKQLLTTFNCILVVYLCPYIYLMDNRRLIDLFCADH